MIARVYRSSARMSIRILPNLLLFLAHFLWSSTWGWFSDIPMPKSLSFLLASARICSPVLRSTSFRSSCCVNFDTKISFMKLYFSASHCTWSSPETFCPRVFWIAGFPLNMISRCLFWSPAKRSFCAGRPALLCCTSCVHMWSHAGKSLITHDIYLLNQQKHKHLQKIIQLIFWGLSSLEVCGDCHSVMTYPQQPNRFHVLLSYFDIVGWL